MMKHQIAIVLIAHLVLAGCKPTPAAKPIPKFTPLQNGFGVVAQWVGVDSGPGAQLFYKGTNETPLLVWPHIGTSGYPILYNNDVALLLADKPDSQGRLGGAALIAVQGTGPAMDISDDVLRLYTLQTNANFNSLLRVYSPLRLQERDEEMTVTYVPSFESRISADLKFPIKWEQIFAIMEDVKRTGRTNKVVNTDVLYLQKVYGEPTK